VRETLGKEITCQRILQFGHSWKVVRFFSRFVGNEEENWRVSHTEVEPPLLRHGSAHSRFGRKKGVVV
jgi:hypothetical protein